MISAATFEGEYAARSGITVEALRSSGRVVWPCDCDEAICQRWQSINRDSVQDEITLHGFPDRPGSRCYGCGGWIDPDGPRAFLKQLPQPGDVGPGEPLFDGAVIARFRIYHEHCAPVGVAGLPVPVTVAVNGDAAEHEPRL